jgi:hypothetical protein
MLVHPHHGEEPPKRKRIALEWLFWILPYVVLTGVAALIGFIISVGVKVH